MGVHLVRREETTQRLLERYVPPTARILDVGSGGVRLRPGAVTFDAQPGRGIDRVGDAHALPFPTSSFDACVLSAVLQYCREPSRVIAEAHRVLSARGLLFLDAPFIQAECPCPPFQDRFRFTRAGLVGLCEPRFEILECGVAIAAGTAAVQYGRSVADRWSSNRYLSFVLRHAALAATWPVTRLRFGSRAEVAGALYLVGRKRHGVRPAPGVA